MTRVKKSAKSAVLSAAERTLSLLSEDQRNARSDHDLLHIEALGAYAITADEVEAAAARGQIVVTGPKVRRVVRRGDLDTFLTRSRVR